MCDLRGKESELQPSQGSQRKDKNKNPTLLDEAFIPCEEWSRFLATQQTAWRICEYKNESSTDSECESKAKEIHSPHKKRSKRSDARRSKSEAKAKENNSPQKCFKSREAEDCINLTRRACRAERKEEAERILKFFDSLFTFVIGTSTLGAGFTFQNIIIPLSKPEGQGDHRYQGPVQRILSISWLMFILALASAGTFASVIGFRKGSAQKRGFGRKHLDQLNGLRWFGFFASTVPVGLLVGAFICLSIVVEAYDSRVGTAAWVFTSVFGLISLMGAVVQSPGWDLVMRLWCCCGGRDKSSTDPESAQ